MSSATTAAFSKRFIGLAAPARSGKDTVANMLLEHDNVAAYALADPLKAACQVLFGLTDEEAWGDDHKELPIDIWGRSPRQFFQRVGTDWLRDYNPDHWLQRAERELLDPPGTVTIPAAWTSHEDTVFRLAAQAVFGLSADQTWSAHGDFHDAYWGATPSAMFELVRSFTLSDYPDFALRRSLRPVAPATRAPRIPDQAALVILKDIRFENEASYIRERGGLVWHIRRDMPRVDDHVSERGIELVEGDVVIDNNGTLQELRAQVEVAWRSAGTR